jgi:glucokinase
MERIPVHVIVNTQVALLGAAAVASRPGGREEP